MSFEDLLGLGERGIFMFTSLFCDRFAHNFICKRLMTLQGAGCFDDESFRYIYSSLSCILSVQQILASTEPE